MHLISASRRTDVPAFYADWFMRRSRAGDVSWVNPFNAQVHTVSLAPGDVAAIVFWTRNFAPMIRHLDELDGRGYRYLVHFTITGLERTYESHVPPLGAAVRQFRRIAERIGPDRILWRYDPILIAPRCGADFHLRNFESLAAALAGATRQCSISFVEVYGKVRRSFTRRGLPIPAPGLEERKQLADRLGALAAARDIAVRACCNDELLGPTVGKARCVDLELIRRLWPELDFEAEPAPTREECGCVRSYDIGAYDTCLHGCIYCYATRDREVARPLHARHDPESPTLIPRRVPPAVP
jgi:Domain of unknown function (DUF1848)